MPVDLDCLVFIKHSAVDPETVPLCSIAASSVTGYMSAVVPHPGTRCGTHVIDTTAAAGWLHTHQRCVTVVAGI